jgi:hypothetical protein
MASIAITRKISLPDFYHRDNSKSTACQEGDIQKDDPGLLLCSIGSPFHLQTHAAHTFAPRSALTVQIVSRYYVTEILSGKPSTIGAIRTPCNDVKLKSLTNTLNCCKQKVYPCRKKKNHRQILTDRYSDDLA